MWDRIFFSKVQETQSLQSQQQIIKVRWFWSFASHSKKKFRLKPTQKPYLDCVWSKPGNKTSVKYSLAPLCQVRDLTGLSKEPFMPGRTCWGWGRGCSLQVHCNTPSGLQPQAQPGEGCHVPVWNWKLYSHGCWQQHPALAGAEQRLLTTLGTHK